MPRYEFRTPRVFADAPLTSGGTVAFNRDQSNYLLNVLRLKAGDRVLLFNGRDGEWGASLAQPGKRALSAEPAEQLRPQPPGHAAHRLGDIFEIVVAGALEPDDHAVAGQLVGAQPFELPEIADALGGGG